MNIQQVLLILWSRKGIIFLLFAFTVATAAIVVQVLPRKYTADTQVILNIAAVNMADGTRLPTPLARQFVITQLNLIASTRVALDVVDTLKLAENPEYIAAFKNAESPGDIRHWIAGGLLKNLKVNRVGPTDIIYISYEASTPEVAADIANAFSAAYLRTEVALKVAPAQQSAAWQSKQLARLNGNLAAAQAKVAKLRKQTGIVTVGDAVDPQIEILSTLNTELVAATAHENQLSTTLEQAKAGQLPPIESIKLTALREQLSSLEIRLAQLTAKYNPKHPQIQKMYAARATLLDEIDQEEDAGRKLLIQQTRLSVAAAVKMHENAAEAVAKQAALLQTRSSSKDKLEAQMGEVAVIKAQMAAINSRRGASELASHVTRTSAAVLTPAVQPVTPTFPQVRLTLLLAAFVGGLGGIAFAFLREMLDRRVRCAADVEIFSKVPVLAILPKAQFRTAPSRNITQTSRPSSAEPALTLQSH